MRGKWHLRAIEKKFYTAVIKIHIKRIEYDITDEVVLNRTRLNPYQLHTILEDLGYEQDFFETNGWEQDCWAEFQKDGCTPLTVYSCGMTFDLILKKRYED